MSRVKLLIFPFKSILSPVFPTSGISTHYPPHYSNWKSGIIPDTILNLLHPHIQSINKNCLLCLQDTVSNYFSLSLCHCLNPSHQHLQPILLPHWFPSISSYSLQSLVAQPRVIIHKWTSNKITSKLKTTQWLPVQIK